MIHRIPLLSLTFDDLVKYLKKKYGKGEYHASAIMREVFLHGNIDFRKVKEFQNSGELAQKITTDFHLLKLPIIKKKEADGVIKWISLLSDGHKIESVMIPMTHHHTLCISSQVGCRMNCKFCQTGQMGFIRQLTTEEIVAQVYAAIYEINAPIRNIVFMGMGEPLDNYNEVIKAIKVLTDQRGFDFPKKFITISTAGHIPGIQKLAKSNPKGIHLAISINTANNALRNKLMPINRKYPLSDLQKTLSKYPLKSRGVLFIEYVLIKDINDSDEDADQLADFVKPLSVRINVIPFNSQPGIKYETPSQEKLDKFCERLIKHKLYVRKRATKGQQVLAACGQLGGGL